MTAGRHDLDGLVAQMHWHGWSARQVRQTVDLLLANGLLSEDTLRAGCPRADS